MSISQKGNFVHACPNCGTRYFAPQHFCAECGRRLSGGRGQTRAAITTDAVAIEDAIVRAKGRIRGRDSLAKESNESARLYISFLAVIALFHGLTLMAGGKISLFNGSLGLLLVAGVLIGAIFKLVFDRRLGYSLTRSLVEVLLFGALTYGSVYGLFWYVHETYIVGGQPMFSLAPIQVGSTPAVPSPTAILP